MSSGPAESADKATHVAAQVPLPSDAHTGGLLGNAATDDQIEKRLDEIEMIGEEQAGGFHAPEASAVTPGMRYLHCSRTIQQLVTDRNRAVGIYLAVASLLWTASSALLNARPTASLMLPIEVIQRWCLPATFAVLTVLAVFVGFLLIRTRVGLIYEVAKMNVLLGLPIGRVKRVNPLSIFFIMQAFISLAGGSTAALLVLHLLYQPAAPTHGGAVVFSVLVGLAVTLLLLLTYVGMVRYTTADQKLQGGVRGS
jgi:hypothetical protein